MGDPALLLPMLYPEFKANSVASTQPLLVPNLNDAEKYADNPFLCLPQNDPKDIIRRITTSEIVIGSSLHAMIVADAFGVPSRPIRSIHENNFKYLDYYEGTRRFEVEFANSVKHALELGPVEKGFYDTEGLLNSFPSDLWPGMKLPSILPTTLYGRK
jgi:hypothetical protein